MFGRLHAESRAPLAVADAPGAVYPPPRHPEAMLLAFPGGRMEVTIAGRPDRCGPGDNLAIPGDAEHAAVVGAEGGA